MVDNWEQGSIYIYIYIYIYVLDTFRAYLAMLFLL